MSRLLAAGALIAAAAPALAVERFPVCQSEAALEQAMAVPEAEMPETCRMAEIQRVGSYCVIDFQIKAGALVGALADLPEKWWSPCVLVGGADPADEEG